MSLVLEIFLTPFFLLLLALAGLRPRFWPVSELANESKEPNELALCEDRDISSFFRPFLRPGPVLRLTISSSESKLSTMLGELEMGVDFFTGFFPDFSPECWADDVGLCIDDDFKDFGLLPFLMGGP
eukprot:CAMPEP_0178799462 /NCGR_PEP_ID=MMETSP0745-20121128/12307_1 /TAXON_ID=913974 /ORGANISM="Nitzschia punctata, Strain CCMP561" /LENGTH=126 /DNA_ID=CAMNT_0020458193 /DNA_START=153 /DNA_END=533 /DNA_ORIENTATION=+